MESRGGPSEAISTEKEKITKGIAGLGYKVANQQLEHDQEDDKKAFLSTHLHRLWTSVIEPRMLEKQKIFVGRYNASGSRRTS